MEFDIVLKIILAVACPVMASALVAAFYFSQTKWEKRREQRFWQTRQTEWIESVGGAK